MKSVKSYRVSLGDMGNISIAVCFDDALKVIGAFLFGQLPDRTNPPAGTYFVDWVNSTPKHPNGIFMMRDVPGHTSEEIHNGNYFGDITKGFKSDIEGCTLAADQIGLMTLEDGTTKQIVVMNSMASLARFNELMGPETFSWTIIDGGSLLEAS